MTEVLPSAVEQFLCRELRSFGGEAVKAAIGRNSVEHGPGKGPAGRSRNGE
jgi:hypothetical protein